MPPPVGEGACFWSGLFLGGNGVEQSNAWLECWEGLLGSLFLEGQGRGSELRAWGKPMPCPCLSVAPFFVLVALVLHLSLIYCWGLRVCCRTLMSCLTTPFVCSGQSLCPCLLSLHSLSLPPFM